MTRPVSWHEVSFDEALEDLRRTEAFERKGAHDTEKAAAAKRRRRGPGQRERALLALADAGEYGRTNYELSLETGILRNCVAARVLELRSAGMVLDSGRRRETDTESPAIVWVLTDRGRGSAELLRKGAA